MTNPQTLDHLDRRDFLAAALGASAALSAALRPAVAEPATPLTRPAAGGTAYTGDTLTGKPVITALDLADLAPGQMHRFYFQGVALPTGQHCYVAVTVAKGAKPGPRVALISGVHGDEMSSIRTVQTVMDQLDPAHLAGSVLAVFDASPPALVTMQRRWLNSGRGRALIDLNREWPGDPNGATASSRHAALLFQQLLAPNADYALDFHTGATGLAAADFILAPMDQPPVRAMVELFPVRQIFDFGGYAGLLAKALADVGIPTFTPEVGAGRIVDQALIPAFVEGTLNVLKHHGLLAGPLGRTSKDSGVFVGDRTHAVLATAGGFVDLHVRLDDPVTSGQPVATQRNAFGEVVAEYTTDVGGRVGGVRTDATAEPGDALVFVLFHSTTPQGENPIDVPPE